MPFEAIVAGDEPLLPRMVERVLERRSTTDLTVQSTDGGGAISICRPDGAVIMSVYGPLNVETEDELRRVFPTVAAEVAVPTFLHELLISTDEPELGTELATALARTIDARLLPLEIARDDHETETGTE